uniref:Uncharacterized protein n=1 Tax=Odontella aurita TaxID=265563 RepID=A0A7S4HJ03_9STRA|mmetsp:Transcript_10751/g.31825  ORF Transcript_10751/g.31825 Transcript_10751/m.31825 type:complete len:164 (+) Transcript_10751:229-720(+)
MEQKVDLAVHTSNYATLSSVFSAYGENSWQTLGQGEQRTLAAMFVKRAVSSSDFLPKAFGSEEAMRAMTVALGHLPPTVENAADNTLRQMMFEFKVNDEEDYRGAAGVLAGLRMEDVDGSVYYMSPADRCDGEFWRRFPGVCLDMNFLRYFPDNKWNIYVLAC